MKKNIFLLLLVGILLFPLAVNAEGSASISASDVVNGNKAKATLNLKNVAAWDIKIEGSGATNGCSIHEVGDSGSGNNINKSFSVECKATSIGTITFTYSGDITSADGTNTPISGSKKINVVKPRDKSTNNNLKALSVSGYTLSPEFNKDILEYTVELESNIEKINIAVEREDVYASVTGEGEKEVSEGDNIFKVVVTSETGQEKVYTIRAIVKDANPIVKVYNNKSYTIIKRASLLSAPSDDFIETTVTISGEEVPAFENEDSGMILIGARDEQQKLSLFVYDPTNNSIKRYEQLVSSPLTIVIEEYQEELEDYEKKTIEIDEVDYEIYLLDDNTALLYGTNVKTNKTGWYSYNLRDKTLQSYNIDSATQAVKDNENKINEYKVVVLVLSGLSLFLLALLIVTIISKRKLRQDFIIQKVNLGIEDELPIIPDEEMIVYDDKKEKKSKKKEASKEKVEEVKEEKKEVVKEPTKEEVKKEEPKKEKTKKVQKEETTEEPIAVKVESKEEKPKQSKKKL